MNRRVLLILLIVIVLVIGGGAYLLSQQGGGPTPPNPTPGGATGGGGNAPPQQQVATPTPIVLVAVVIATQELPRGVRIPQNGLDIQLYPVEAVPALAIKADQTNPGPALALVVGKIARVDIARDQPILSDMLVDDLTQLASIGSDAAAVLPAGERAIAVPIDRNSGIAYAPRDGDHVDVIASFLFADVDQVFQSRLPNTLTLTTIKQDGTITVLSAIQGRLEASSFSQFPVITGPSETQRPRLGTQMIVQNAFVLHVGNFPLEGSFVGSTPTPLPSPTPEGGNQNGPTPAAPPPTSTPAIPDVITLGVSPQDAVTLAWLMDARVPLTLVLRNARDQNKQPTTEVTLRYIVQNFGVEEPPALPFALEPALRSVRSITNGTLVPFSSDALVGSGGGH